MQNDDELVEKVRDAIFNAENGIDGDQIGDMLHDDFRIPSENSVEATKMVCERAARAAIAVMRETGWTPPNNTKGNEQ